MFLPQPIDQMFQDRYVIAITTVGECAVVIMEGEQILREMKRCDSLCEVTQDIKVHSSLLLVPRPSFNPPKRKGGSGEYSTAFLYLPQKFRGRIRLADVATTRITPGLGFLTTTLLIQFLQTSLAHFIITECQISYPAVHTHTPQ